MARQRRTFGWESSAVGGRARPIGRPGRSSQQVGASRGTYSSCVGSIVHRFSGSRLGRVGDSECHRERMAVHGTATVASSTH